MRPALICAAVVVTGAIVVPGLAGAAQKEPATRIPLWHEGSLVTGLLLHGAEPGQPGFRPLPDAQTKNSDNILYVILDNEQQQTTVEVIDHVPGERGYSGGRWRVMEVGFVSESDEIPVTSAEQVETLAAAGKVTVTDPGITFECPVVSDSWDG